MDGRGVRGGGGDLDEGLDQRWRGEGRARQIERNRRKRTMKSCQNLVI